MHPKTTHMKRILPAVLFALFVTPSFSQGMFGVQGGIGFTTGYKTYYTPSFEGCYLAKVSPHIYLGGALAVQRYSFLDDLDKGNNLSYGDIISIRQKSSYVFFKPKFDLGIGARKHMHLTFSCGPGVFMSGNKTTQNYEPLVSPTGGYSGADTVSNSIKYNMRTVVFQATPGIWERIPTHGYWNITLSQELNYISSKLNYPGTNLKTNYILFSVGIMHKYPHVVVEY